MELAKPIPFLICAPHLQPLLPEGKEMRKLAGDNR